MWSCLCSVLSQRKSLLAAVVMRATVVVIAIAVVMFSVHLFKHHVEISIGRIVDVFIE